MENKKIASLAAAVALLLSAALPVWAEAPTSTGNASPPGGGPERRAALEAKRQENIRRFFNQAVTRQENQLAKLETLTKRIEARLAALDAQDKATAEAKAFVAKAKTAWQQATDDIAAAKTKLEEMLNSETPKAAFQQVKTAVRRVQTDIKETHGNLVKAITKIIGLRVGRPAGNQPPSTGTSTPTTTATGN